MTLFYFRDKFKLLAGSSCLQIYTTRGLVLSSLRANMINMMRFSCSKKTRVISFDEIFHATCHAKAIEEDRPLWTHDDLEGNSFFSVCFSLLATQTDAKIREKFQENFVVKRLHARNQLSQVISTVISLQG